MKKKRGGLGDEDWGRKSLRQSFARIIRAAFYEIDIVCYCLKNDKTPRRPRTEGWVRSSASRKGDLTVPFFLAISGFPVSPVGSVPGITRHSTYVIVFLIMGVELYE